MTSEDRILEFAGATLNSVWALELLLMLRREPTRRWTTVELIRELRGSQVSVGESLNNLRNAGLIVEEEDQTYRYEAGRHVDELVDALAALYAAKPTAVIRAIVLSPNRKLQILSDAFRIKK
jgi:hypothetical protein